MSVELRHEPSTAIEADAGRQSSRPSSVVPTDEWPVILRHGAETFSAPYQAIAQLAEHPVVVRGVVGSSPTRPLQTYGTTPAQPGNVTELPTHDEAHLALEKLSQYALNGDSTDGKHKAYLFRSVLDLGPEDAEQLRDQLLAGLSSGTVTGTRETPWGQRYQVEIPVLGNNDRTANVETVWQVEEEATLRFITVRSIRPSGG